MAFNRKFSPDIRAGEVPKTGVKFETEPKYYWLQFRNMPSQIIKH